MIFAGPDRSSPQSAPSTRTMPISYSADGVTQYCSFSHKVQHQVSNLCVTDSRQQGTRYRCPIIQILTQVLIKFNQMRCYTIFLVAPFWPKTVMVSRPSKPACRISHAFSFLGKSAETTQVQHAVPKSWHAKPTCMEVVDSFPKERILRRCLKGS